MAEPDDPLLDRVRDWLAEDPDPATRAELVALLEQVAAGDSGARHALDRRFAGRLEFGTAGLRGPLGAGPTRMNRAVVTRTAAGLAAYLLRDTGPRTPALVVGFDARHGSDTFARDTAEVAAGAGVATMVLPRPLPTPVLAHAVRSLGADAGVMVTASHNPATDNGYKVYLGDGRQIAPPADRAIAACIDAVGPLPLLPRSDDWTTLDASVDRPGVLDDYLASAAALVAAHLPAEARPAAAGLRVVHTALHGVGGEVVRDAFRRAGLPDPVPVVQQAPPDPDFPTVGFPNPELPGTLDLALALARRVGADLVLANDPDADRCAVAVPDPGTAEGWRRLTGDEVGGLLGELVAGTLVARGGTGTLATTVVSSTLLRSVAAEHGLPFRQTLTGFKWLSRVPDLAYGYEEALGYCCDPGAVRDKDGVTAALLVVVLAARLRAAGLTLLDALDRLALRHGVHHTAQLVLRLDDGDRAAPLMAGLRAVPPSVLGGVPVTGVSDLGRGLAGLPPTDAVRLALPDGWVVVRPSGTEPVVKAYVEVVRPAPADVGDLAAVRAGAAAAATAVLDDLALLLGEPR